jgi:glutathione S-transferase
MTRNVLITIPPSHYCEKARWALDRAGILYREEGHAPIVHYLFALPRSRTRTVPILLREGEAPITESTDILRFADRDLPESERLFPTEPALRTEVEALVEKFDVELGPPVRRHAYCYVARSRDAFLEIFVGTLGPAERFVVTRGEAALRAALRRAFAVSDRAAEKTRNQVAAVFADVSARIADGRPFLFGDRFTAADLTFAALASPLLSPRVSVDLAPTGLRDTIDRLRATPAGALGLRLLEERRRLRPHLGPSCVGA